MKKLQLISFLFAFIICICGTYKISAQSQFSDLNSFAWKEKSIALETILQLQQRSNDQLSTSTSVRPAGSLEFSQVLNKKVYDKINSGIAIPVSIEEGFNESSIVVDNDLLLKTISVDDRQSVVALLIEALLRN